MIIMSVFAFLGMLMMTRGMMLEKPGKAAVINYLNIVLAIIYSSFILNEELDFLTILGSLSILSTAVLLFYKNWMIKEEL
jgi:drug/metabolite transporter (DMT)-like permease